MIRNEQGRDRRTGGPRIRARVDGRDRRRREIRSEEDQSSDNQRSDLWITREIVDIVDERSKWEGDRLSAYIHFRLSIVMNGRLS